MKTHFLKLIFGLVIALTMLTLVSPAPVVAASHSQGITTYSVRRGDMLYSIARRYGTSVAAIKSDNGLRSNTIYIGQTLKIARSGSSAAAVSSSSSSSSDFSLGCGDVYTVRSGDTLARISRLCGVGVARIKALNSMSSNVIRIGQKLRMTGVVATPTPRPPSSPTPEPPVTTEPSYPTPVY